MNEGILIEVMRFSEWSENSYRLQVAPKHALFLPKSCFLGFYTNESSRKIYVKEWWFYKNIDWLCRLN